MTLEGLCVFVLHLNGISGLMYGVWGKQRLYLDMLTLFILYLLSGYSYTQASPTCERDSRNGFSSCSSKVKCQRVSDILQDQTI